MLELSTKVYGALVTVAGTLERLKPEIDVLEAYESRIRSIYGLITFEDKEWLTKARATLVIPEDFFMYKVRLMEVASAYNTRLSTLQRAQELISRLQTLHQALPASPVTKVNAPESNQALSSLVSTNRSPRTFGIPVSVSTSVDDQ